MDYGRLVSDAWRVTWRHRFLWWFALFGGAQGGGCSFNYGQRFSPRTGGGAPQLPGGPEMQRVAGVVAAWVTSHLALVVAVGLLFFLLVLAFVVVSFVARGALIGSTARVALGEPTTTREGWAIGRRLGWRYARLFLLLIALGLAVFVTLALLLVLVVTLFALSRVLGIVVGALLGLAAVGALIALGIAASIALSLADRAIALDDLGARAGLRRAIALMRLQLGTSLILWLLSVGLGIGIAIGFVILLLVLALPLGGLALAAYASSGLGAQTLLVGLFDVLALVTILWVVGAIAGTFTSTYWTLAYLSLTGRYPRGGEA